MKRFTTKDGLSLAYSDQGTGPALLCLSGLTRNSTDFDFVVPHIKGVRLIRMDYRGRGQSEHAKDWTSYTIPQEADDVLTLLDHLELEKTAILGTSRGGLIAMYLAATAKDRLSGVMLNDIGPELAPEGLQTIMGFLGLPPRFRSYAEAETKLPDASVGFANIPAKRWAQDIRNRWAETANGLALRYDPKLRDAVEASSHGDDVDLWAFFDALSGLPLALVRGENSDLLSPHTVAEMRKRRPDMIYQEAKDRAHIPYLDEPESLEALGQFLKEIT